MGGKMYGMEIFEMIGASFSYMLQCWYFRQTQLLQYSGVFILYLDIQ
jgi:hypothetical protein